MKGNKTIILASGSPRRKELLAGLDIEFETDTRNRFKEDYSIDTPHRRIPALMSEGKSYGFHRPLAPDEILITADTLVLCGNEVLGKPKGEDDTQKAVDAARMLRILSGREHEVITAVTIRDNSRHKTFSDIAEVRFREDMPELLRTLYDEGRLCRHRLHQRLVLHHNGTSRTSSVQTFAGFHVI